MISIRVVLPGLILALMPLCGAPALGQMGLASQPLSVETVGGNGKFASNAPMPTMPGLTMVNSRNRDPVGKPCLIVSPSAESQTLNRNVFNHFLTLDNHCGKTIRIRACYYKTSSCTDMSVGGYKREQHMLGIFSYADFQYSFREYVN